MSNLLFGLLPGRTSRSKEPNNLMSVGFDAGHDCAEAGVFLLQLGYTEFYPQRQSGAPL